MHHYEPFRLRGVSGADGEKVGKPHAQHCRQGRRLQQRRQEQADRHVRAQHHLQQVVHPHDRLELKWLPIRHPRLRRAYGQKVSQRQRRQRPGAQPAVVLGVELQPVAVDQLVVKCAPHAKKVLLAAIAAVVSAHVHHRGGRRGARRDRAVVEARRARQRGAQRAGQHARDHLLTRRHRASAAQGSVACVVAVVTSLSLTRAGAD
mmetsp:Transcript_33805/g.86401  ORF Transcript_33805/g.86401 Transcript_33805/m.86401 type:complete len:205 (-) Transcript_33805:151-765(-)